MLPGRAFVRTRRSQVFVCRAGGFLADPRFGELSFEDRNGDDVLDLLYPGYSLTAFNGIEITAADGSSPASLSGAPCDHWCQRIVGAMPA